MNLYKRNYIKIPPTNQEIQLYEDVLRAERESV